MANISLKSMLEASIDPKLVARSKESGKLVYFKTPQAKANAVKAGSHEEPKKDKKAQAKQAAQSADIFKGDYEKERGTETPKVDVKSIIKGVLKTANKEFAGVHKLKDIVDDVEFDTSDSDGKDLQSRIDKGEDGTYVQTDETEGTIVFNDGTQYQLHHVEDGPIPVTKVGANSSKASADVKSIVKGILKTANKEFAGTHKLKDIVDDVEFDTMDDDGKDLQSRIDKGEDGIYVQTDETEGTIVFSDGTQYQLHHVEDGPIPVTKVGAKTESTKLTSMIKK